MVSFNRERFLILAYDHARQIVTCFNKSNYTIFYVKIKDEVTDSVALLCYGNFLSFPRRLNRETSLSGPISRRWSEISVERPITSDCIRIEYGEIKICSWIGFSSNPSHRTFDRKVAFSDWYGLVDCNGRKLLDRKMYKVYIVLNDINYINNGTCLFRLDQISNRSFNDYQRNVLLDKLEKFERKIGPKYHPITGIDSISLKNEPRPALQSSTRMPIDENEAIEAIVLAVKDSTANCYSEQLESQITVCMPIGFLVREGQMITFRNHDYVNDIYIPVPNATKTQDCNRVRFQNKTMLIKAVAACSDIPRHQTYNQRLAYAGPFGIVKLLEELPSRGHAFNVELVINDLDASKNGTQLFQVGQIFNQIEPENSIKFMKKLRNFENLQDCWETIPRVLNDENQQGTSSRASDAVQPSLNAPVISIPEPVRVALDDLPIENRIPIDYQPEKFHFPILSAANSIIAESSLTSLAVVTAQSDGYHVVYLFDKNAGAFLKLNEFDMPTLLVGTVFKCTYVGAQFSGMFWEVTSVLELVGGKSECRIVDGKCQLLFSIDLCNRNELFAEHWMSFGEPPIVSSEVGFITMEHSLKDPEGNIMRCHELSRKYMGRERAANMLGWCSFVQYDVPRMTVDSEYVGDETVYTFGWRINEVSGSYDQVQRMERNLIESNLGNRAQELEIEDDVARQKRMNKEVSELESRISSRAASTVGGDSRRPSSSRHFHYQQGQNLPVSHNSSSSVYNQNIAPFNTDSPADDPKVKQIKLLQSTLARSIRINEQLFVDGEDAIRKVGQIIDTTQWESHLEQCSMLIREYRGKKQHLMSNLNII